MANWCDKWKNNDKTSAAVNGPLTFDSNTGTVHAQERAVTPKFTITTSKATSRATTQRNLSDWLSYDTKKASNRLTGLNSKLKSLTSSSVGVSAFGAGGGNTMHKTSKERKDLQAQIKALTAEINTAKQYQAEAEAVKNEDRLLKYNVDDAQKRLTEMKNSYAASYRAADNVRALGATPNVSHEQKELQSQIEELSDELERAKSVQYSKKGSDTLDKLKTDSLAAWGAVDVLASDNAVDDTRALGAYSGVANRNTDQARMKLKAMGYEDKDIEQLVDYRKRQRNKERYVTAIQQAQEMANDGFGGAVAASADSVARRLWSGLGTIDIALQNLRKDDRPIDYYTGSMALAAVADAERAQVSQNIIDSVDNTGLGETLAFLYQTGMSMADSAVTMLAAGAMGAAAGAGATATKAAKMAGLMLMGGGASTTAITAAKERGLSDKQALALGLCAGAAEVITEKIGVDQFLNTISAGSKRALVEIGKNALAEGSEEVGSEFLNLFADIAVSGDKSEWKKSIHAYKELGYGDNEALSLAFADKAKEIGVSFLGGALSGGVFGTAGVAINRLQTNDLRVKVAAATMMDEDTQSYRIAQQIQELVTAEVPQETTDNLLAVLTDSLDKHMRSELSAEERKSIMQKARAVVRADKQDRKTVQKATNQVAKMMAENAGAVRSADESTAEDVQSQTPARSYATTQIATAVGSVVSTGRPLSDKLTNEIIADRASVEALGLEYGGEKTLANMTATQSRAAVRKAVQEHKAQVEAETAAETTEAPAAEQTAQTETAPEQEGFTSYEQFSKEFREDEHFKDYSEEEMQRMYQLTKEWNKRRESKVFLSDIGRVVSLSEFRQFAKQAEKQDSTEYTEEEILGAFDAAVESTKADVERHEADRKANLDTMAQNIKSAFEARKLGIDVEVVYGENEYFQVKGTRENAVVVGNKIVFNGNVINSGEAMLYVLGHELVHPGARVDKGLVDTIIKTFQYLADNGIIKGKLAKRVKNIEDTIESTRELYQQHENELAAKENREAVEQTTDKVREEVAADLMREAFASTEICKEIVGYNPGLANKVKDAIRRVKNAITGADGKLNPEAQQKLDDLNKQFDDALKLVAEKNSRFNDDNVEGKVDSGAEPGVPNPSQPQFSLSTWEQPNYKSQFSGAGFSRSLAKDGDSYVFRTGHDVLSDLLDKEGVDANVADRVLTWMDGMADFMRNAGVKYQFINLAEVNNAKVSVRYDTDGKPLSIALSAMVKNGEYPVNFDLTQICKRREAMSKFVNKLLAEHNFDEFSLSKANLLEMMKILSAEGYDTACTGCFVESKRYYMEDFTKRFIKKWNDAVKKINPKADYFNFADANREISPQEIEDADEAMEAFRSANAETSAQKTANIEETLARISESGLSTEDIELIRDSNKRGHEAVDADRDAGKEAKFDSQKYVSDKKLAEFAEPRAVTADELKYLVKHDVFGGKKANNAEQIENLVKSDPVFQRLLTPADIMTTSGLTQFTQLSDTLVSLLSGSYGSGAPKLAQGFIPYNNEIAFLPDKVGKINLSEYLQGIAGLRSQSFSDFKIENVFDYFQMAAELTARHLPAHMYTKELACAKILGMLGVKVNMSVMFNIEGDEYWGSEEEARKYAGLIRDKDGNITYNYADKANSDRVFEETGKRPFIQSIDVAGAFELQDDPRYSKNIGVIGVGYSDEHIRMMLNDPRFRYIIPYHRSSLPVEISNGTNLNRATNYTSTQNTLSFKVLKPDGKGVSMRGKSFKSSAEFLSWVEENGYTLETKKAQAGHGEFDLYGDLEKTNDPKQTAENYKAWCWEHGYLPLFYQFSSEENYYKLLYDFAVYDHEGNYAPQGAVQMWNEDGEMTGFPDDITDVVETEMKAQNSVNEELWNPEKVEHVVDTIYNTVKLDKGEEQTFTEGASSVSDIHFSLGTVNGEAMAIVDSINAPATVTDAEAYLQAIANNPEVFATTLDGATEVYLGQDLPGEYTWSFDTRRAGYFDKRAKMQASTVLKDMIYLGENGRWKANAKEKHAIDAANGWTRFDVKFAVPGLNDTYKVYTGYAVIRNDADGKSYLYDVVNVKYKETLPSDRVVLNRNDSNNTPAMRDKTAPLTGDSVAQDNGEVNKNFSLSSVAVNSNQFKNADNLNPTAGPDIRYSLSPVDPVQPSTTKWNRTKTTDEALAAFPNMWNVSAEESETRNPTQIKATVGTYRKIFNILKDEGFNGTILDASSGLGVGTEAGRNEFGFDVDDIEPYPDSGYTPKYTDYSKLNKKYDVIISSAVLNVLPQDQRDALVSKMGQLLNDGGRMFITTRGTDVESLAKTGKNIHLGNMEWIETVKGSYQKGFTNSELIAYLQDALGDGFTVVPASKETGGKFNNNTNVVVTKRASESMSRYSVEDDELKSFLDAYDEAFGEGASKADFTNLNQQLRAARRARRTAEMAEESKQAKISLSNRGRLATERAWEIYHKRTVRTVRNEYRAKLEQSRKDKIAAVKQAVVVERVKAEVKLEEQELAERMNAKKQAAKRLGLKDEQIQQMNNKSKEKSQLQRNASRNTLKNKRLADKKRAAIETEQGPISTIRENPQQRTFTEKLQSSAENLRTKGRSLYKNFVNKAMHIDRVAKRQTSHMNASVLASIVSSCNSTVSDIYTKGLTDRQGNMVGKSMKEVFLCLDEKGNIDYDKQALFQDYALYLHNMDRMSFVAKARAKLEAFEAANSWLAEMDKNEFARLTAMTEAELEKTGKQQAHDLAVKYSQLLQEYSEATDKPVFPDKNGNPITAETSRQVVAKYEAENPWLKEKAQEMYDWWDQFMKIWVVGDSITQEQYDTMRETYPHYVPTYRVDGKGLSGAVSIGAKGAKPGQVVKSAKGGLGEIVNIEDSFANLAAKAVKSARVNELYKNLVDTAMLDDAGVFEDYMLFDWDSVEQGASYATQTGEVVSVYGNSFDVGESVDAAEAPGLVKTKDGYKVSAWYNGRLLSTYVSEDLFTSLQETTGAVKDKLDKVAKVGSVLTNPMKTAITGVNPNFALRNTLRDFPTAVINSVSGLAFPKYWARAWKEIYRSDAWHNFVALGGTNSLYYNTEGGFGKAMSVERGAAGTVKRVWNGTKNVMGFLNETTESVTRFAEYLATIDRMGDTYENRLIGIKNAAEVTVDFSRKGSYGAAINAWVPYWNPAVQGIDKVFRSVFEAPNGKKAFAHGMATLGRAVMTTVLLEAIQQVILAALGRRDDWEELNDRTKDTYYCIPTKDHKFIKIPKNREWGAILGTPLMRLFEGFTGKDDPFENFLETSIIPNFLPGGPTDLIGLSQYIDIATNKDFAGRSIVPYAYTQGSLAGQYDDKTSEMAKLFSKLLGEKLGPMQVDYIIQDYFGDFGDIATMLTAKSTWGEDESVKGILESLWKTVESPWVTDNRYSNADVSVYYENIDELERTWNDKKNHGDGEFYKDSIEYKTFQAVVYKSYGKEISEINKQIKDLPDGEEKDELKGQIAQLAAQANEFIDKCLSGDIEAPDLVFEYENLPVQVSDELIRLRSLSDEYSFKPSPSSSKSYVDPTSKVGNKAATREYVLDDEAKAQYNSIYEDTYSKTMQATINSYEYRKANDTHKAEMLEDARDTVAPAVKEEFMLWLQRNRKPTQRKK